MSSFEIIPLDQKMGEPGFYIKYKGEHFLLDAPLALYRRHISTSDLNKLVMAFITHRHRDHFGGIDRMLFEVEKLPAMVGNQGLRQGLINKLSAYDLNLGGGRYRLFGHEVAENGWTSFIQENLQAEVRLAYHPSNNGICRVLETAEYVVEVVALRHGSINSIAFSLAEKDKYTIDKERLYAEGLTPGPWVGQLKDAALNNDWERSLVVANRNIIAKQCRHLLSLQAGEKIVYATDFDVSAFNEERLLTLLIDADVFLCEASYLEDDLSLALKNGHQTSVHAAQLAQRAKIKKLHLFHHSLRYGKRPDIESVFVQQAQSYFDGEIC